MNAEIARCPEAGEANVPVPKVSLLSKGKISRRPVSPRIPVSVSLRVQGTVPQPGARTAKTGQSLASLGTARPLQDLPVCGFASSPQAGSGQAAVSVHDPAVGDLKMADGKVLEKRSAISGQRSGISFLLG